jgi:hypothetical protein
MRKEGKKLGTPSAAKMKTDFIGMKVARVLASSATIVSSPARNQRLWDGCRLLPAGLLSLCISLAALTAPKT